MGHEIIKNIHPLKFGGWLLLPMFALLMPPIIYVGSAIYIAIHEGIFSMFSPSTWNIFTESNALAYDSTLVFYLVASAVANFLVISANILLIVLASRKKKTFPIAIIYFYLFNVLIALMNMYAVKGFITQYYPVLANELASKVTNDFVLTTATLLIWGTYFRVSTRVKNTFIN